MFDLPENIQWSLNKFIRISGKDKDKFYYLFEIWKKGKPLEVLTRFETSTPKQMAKKIKELAKKLNKKK